MEIFQYFESSTLGAAGKRVMFTFRPVIIDPIRRRAWPEVTKMNEVLETYEWYSIGIAVWVEQQAFGRKCSHALGNRFPKLR